jgi:hypothetical protein
MPPTFAGSVSPRSRTRTTARGNTTRHVDVSAIPPVAYPVPTRAAKAGPTPAQIAPTPLTAGVVRSNSGIPTNKRTARAADAARVAPAVLVRFRETSATGRRFNALSSPSGKSIGRREDRWVAEVYPGAGGEEGGRSPVMTHQGKPDGNSPLSRYSACVRWLFNATSSDLGLTMQSFLFSLLD